MTIVAIGIAQNIIIRRLFTEALDNSLIEDAQATIGLMKSLPRSTNPEEIMRHGELHATSSLRDLIDHVLSEVPDTLKGQQLSDRVLSEIVNEILAELSIHDSSGKE